MTLDEAIKYCEEMAEKQRSKAHVYEDMMVYNQTIKHNSEAEYYEELMNECYKCAEEYRQFAGWLQELKKYRIAHWKLRDMDYEYDFNSMFGDNPMYYVEKVWDLFGAMYASVEYEVMGYEEVNADEDNNICMD